ncbi:putative aquaporin TIP5-1 [Apostasia shenzhenica]|uniref:Putative aquaporin TIP5-1 n=1 Tax=Apostasia shenzhenica TaxID=1088818 RepID=A0A2I0AVJ7_9ASPA|nr:putative aquaporin TIP5-1 [Apostasia shenzhenica]
MASLARHQLQQCISPFALRSYLAELISSFLFVFAAVGSTISARMLTPEVASNSSSLVATAMAQAFALFAAVYIAVDVSGGHVNPAVTFALAVGGHITVPVGVFYLASQLIGSILACLLLHLASAGQAIPTPKIATEMTGFGAAILEGSMTFALVYTIYVAADPRAAAEAKGGSKGHRSAVGLMAVGLVAGSCVLAGGSLTGASMNPARSFGPAIVSGDFKNHAVYWVGPLIGAGLAGLVHQNLIYPSSTLNSIDVV